MTIQKILMCAGLVSVAVAMLALIVPVCNAHGFHPVQDLLRGYRALPWYAWVFITLFTMVFILHGSTKTNTPPSGVEGGVTNTPWAGEGEMPTNTPPSLMMMAWRGTRSEQQQGGEGSGTTGFTEAQIGAGAVVVGVGTGEAHGFAPPEGAHVVERWRLRGVADERVRIVEGVEIDTFGRIRMDGRVFAPLGIQLGMVPEANWERIGRPSLAWWMHTESNSTVVCWMNALLNRDTNTPVCVMAEFQDNGKFEYRYDLSSVGEGATNVFARIVTTNGVEEVGLVPGVTSVRGHLLRPEDAWDSDRDRDGVTTHDEIFVYGTDPDLPDTDGDGRTDGEEIFVNGGDPLVGEAADAETLARIAAGETNGPCVIVEGELNSTKLWDGFALAGDPGTNALYTRTFAVDRKRGWTSYFLSGRGEAWCRDGKDAIRSWSLEGLEIAWADDTGRSGVATASPHDDTLLLPLATNATSVTVTLRAVGTGRRASPRPLYLLEYTPKVMFPGSQEIAGNDGNGYCVYTDPEEMSFALDQSNRPCLAPPGEGEATEDDFALPAGTGVYALPTCETVEPDARPRLLAAADGISSYSIRG